MSAMERMAAFLDAEFGLAVQAVRRIALEAHNKHFVVTSGGVEYHVTLRDLRSEWDTPEVIEQILAWSMRLPGATGLVARSQLRSRTGTYLSRFDGGQLSVRLHLGIPCEKDAELSTIVDCAEAHGRSIDSVASFITLERGGLRYRPVAESFALIRGRCQSFVAEHAGANEMVALMSAIEPLAIEISGPASRLVHGDLSFTNLIDVCGDVSVIDQDCLHSDHPLYDHAHLLVSVSSSKYFHGELSVDAVERYLERWCQVVQDARPDDLLLACQYVVLKKLALVQQPKNLHLADRIEALHRLEGIRKCV